LLARAGGLVKRGIEDLLLDLRVDLHFAVDLLQQIFGAAIAFERCALQLLQQAADLVVIFFQQREGVDCGGTACRTGFLSGRHRSSCSRRITSRAYCETMARPRTSRISRKTFSGGIPRSRCAAARLKSASAVFSSSTRASIVRLFNSQNAKSDARATRRFPPRNGACVSSAKRNAATLSGNDGYASRPRVVTCGRCTALISPNCDSTTPGCAWVPPNSALTARCRSTRSCTVR